MKLSIILLLFLGIIPPSHASPQYLIIHGTWSKQFDWHMPGGDFYDALARQSTPGTVSFFLWSGKNRDSVRKAAAQKLVEYIKLFYRPSDELILIGHSHGGNVALIASQLLGAEEDNQFRIHALITLGTPISMQSYWPQMQVIEKLYNLFSFNDFVQPVLGCFEREFPAHERIENIEVLINRKEPQHSDLHHPLIAQWIAQLEKGVSELFQKPVILYLDEDEQPCIVLDPDRDYKRKRDRKILFALNHLMYNQQWRKLTKMRQAV